MTVIKLNNKSNKNPLEIFNRYSDLIRRSSGLGDDPYIANNFNISSEDLNRKYVDIDDIPCIINPVVAVSIGV